MPKSILLTGSTGFIGRNLIPLLSRCYNVTAPSRSQLDLILSEDVEKFLRQNRYDAIVHLANPTGQTALDGYNLFERSLRVFDSLARCSPLYGKMIYLGSGAEYGKHRALAGITEEEFGNVTPQDPYGFARYMMSKLAERYDNIINLRLFACYGPTDPPYKLIPHIISCIRESKDVTLRQDVWFDFLFVTDIYPIIMHFIEYPSKHRFYNLCSGERILISSIAREVQRQMGSNLPIVFEKEGLNLEYTGMNTRLLNEMPNWKLTNISGGIKKILDQECTES